MNLSLRRSTSALLASSLLLTIGRGATLPFMTIYLSRQYSLSVDLIGYAMTIALTIGVVFSLGFGILADKFDKKRYMLLAITAFASGFIAIPLVNNVTLVVLFFALINCAYSVFATVLKAWFADNLSSTSKTKIFSINYTMLNIGWTIGPPLGTLLVMQSINLPFWLAAICSAFPMLFIQIWVKRSEKIIATETGSVWSPKVLLQDKALLWFTCSGFLASFVSGAFASCISKQLTKALSKLSRSAYSDKLTAAFQSHLDETHGQIERIDQVVDSEDGLKLKRIKCAAMEGLIEEANEVIESTDKNEVRDAALIAAAQKVEHYEIASYGTLVTLAEQLGYKKAAKLLKETLEEEKATDVKLTDLAFNNVNKKAQDNS